MISIKEELQIKEILYNSEEYCNELELRDKVLRKPLGMSLYNESLDVEKNDVHIGAFLNSKLVGVLILTKLNTDEVKMRQVAVVEDMRNQTIGSKLVRYAEEYSIKAGYSKMILNARKTAVGFYKGLGYSIINNEFMEINIPHYKMIKRLLE